MATASTSANDLTRQQLDELDSLLQRMLSLPINPAEPAPPPIPVATLAAFAPPLPPPPISQPLAYSPPPAPPARRAEPSPRLFTPPVEEAARFDPSPTPRVGVASLSLSRVELPPPPTPAPAPAVAMPAPMLPGLVEEETFALPVAAELPAAHATEPVPIVLAPMVLFNRVLNWGLGLFGLPGRVLRSGLVKNLFGLAGLGLIGYTGAKVAQIHGWLTRPVELPWPR